MLLPASERVQTSTSCRIDETRERDGVNFPRFFEHTANLRGAGLAKGELNHKKREIRSSR